MWWRRVVLAISITVISMLSRKMKEEVVGTSLA